jgi:4-diphosphocytidyl-2C-methyl-D-erythritol kinase
VGMSGSGTSCFALCPTAEHARRLARRLRSAVPGRVLALDSRN